MKIHIIEQKRTDCF